MVAIVTNMEANKNRNHIEISDQLMHLLYQTTRAISKNLNHLLGVYDLFSSEWTIIKVIKEKGTMSQASLAGYLNIEPAAISKSLLRLEKKKIIERRVGSDKREKSVFLTQMAIEQYPVWSLVVAGQREQMLGSLPTENQKELIAFLKKIYENAQHEIV
jgi:DNA-binding MarR family transcriptional regulator